MHTNDVHARILPIDDFDQTCDPDDKSKTCYGGAARRVTLINQLRKENPNNLLLDAGDQFQGTSFYSTYKGQEASIFMNLMRYDAMAVGNHEFDNGPDVFASFIKDTQFPVLSANIDASKHDKLSKFIKPYSILQINSERVGIVGFTTEETADLSQPGDKIKFNNIEKSLEKTIRELKNRDVNKIIAVSHSGYGRDKQVASRVSGIDVIISGHTNSYLSNKSEVAGDDILNNIDGPYPTVVKSPENEPVLIVSAYAYGKYLGNLDVEFDSQGNILSYRGEPILIDSSMKEDKEAKGIAKLLFDPIKEIDQKVVGFLPVSLDGKFANCRFKQCSMGDAIADALLWKTKNLNTQISLVNAGGIRASIDQGDLLDGEVQQVFPFENKLKSFWLKGAKLKSTLEHSVSHTHDKESEVAGKFLQVSGLKFTYNDKLKPGSRVSNIQIKSEFGEYLNLDPKEEYKLIANDFILGGGDGYQVLKNNIAKAKETGLFHKGVFIDYVNRMPQKLLKFEEKIISAQ